ncbi:alpha/beta hydrolase [Ideonella sp. 4Y11]|uniref:Alpha/beta hydrolase n=1 Tax=Ideonella aquatica TaxID=2824119 RepID=A0A941BES0_9BURK|nr:alpha/beta hydrolase [Ideonella aquatica]MBQ0958016.1 alpha/beta hydrolase [Ideonella aquatica]
MREGVVALSATGQRLHTWRAGEQGPRVLLLHGFPEAGFIWQPVMQRLQGQARLLAPTQRGYAPSSCPEGDAAYKPRALVADLVALIEQEGAPVDLVVAHDWGGALAWNLAAQRPDLLRRLLIVNATHPVPFLRALREDPAQQAASAYMNTLCAPGAAERLAADDFQALWPFFEHFGPGSAQWLDTPLRERYRALWGASLDSMLAWYRMSPLRPPLTPQDPVMTLQLPDEAVTVRVPTRVLWGEADRALPPSLLGGLEAFVPDLTVERVPGASHWIVHEQPERVAQAIIDALP